MDFVNIFVFQGFYMYNVEHLITNILEKWFKIKRCTFMHKLLFFVVVDYLAFEFLTIKIFLNLRGFQHKNIIFGIIWSSSKIRAVGQNIFLHLRSGVGLSVFLWVCLLVCFCLFSCLYFGVSVSLYFLCYILVFWLFCNILLYIETVNYF